MARNRKRNESSDAAARDDEGGEAKRGATPEWRMKLEEAWEGWLRPVGLIVVCIGLYLAYRADLLPESTAGFLVVAAVALGPAALAAMPAWERAKKLSPVMRGLFVAMMAAWLVGVGYPSLRAASPPKPIAETQLREGLTTNVAKLDAPGTFEVMVSGHFKQAGLAEAEASYTIEARTGLDAETFSGTLKRSLVRVRAGRRGGVSTSLAERTENVHRLTTVRGPQITFSTPGLDDQLAPEGLVIAVRKAGPNPIVFWVLSALALALALFFDGILTEPRSKERTYLAMAAGLALVFGIAFPDDATPHSLVRPAIGAFVLALLTGAIGGWLLSAVIRLARAPRRVSSK
jgi:hypothetical protein